MTFDQWFSQQFPHIPLFSAQSVLELTAEKATVPFIARYRKEKTGNLDEVAIQSVIDSKETWDQLIKRQQFILSEIEKQNKLTEPLKQKILSTFHADQLEDLYLPYKQKKKTKAALAKEAGLLPLADWIWDCGHGVIQSTLTPEEEAKKYCNPEHKIHNAQDALQGASALLIERLSENTALRHMVRTTLLMHGILQTQKAEAATEANKFEKYFSFEEKISSLLEGKNSHRYLAIKRGWTENQLVVKIGGILHHETIDTVLLKAFETESVTNHESLTAAYLKKAARLALHAHVLPSIETEIHRSLKESADLEAIRVFTDNIKKLLLAAPLGAKSVLGIDPGIRTGCKIALINASGQYLASTVIHLQTAEEKKTADRTLLSAIETARIEAIAIGNGTASQETEHYIRDLLKRENKNILVAVVSEAGASVYSASETAREEFPELDLTIRSAISIARRLQDPLAELVKIEPKSIGVGQY